MVLKNRPVIVERKAMFVVFVGSTFAVDDVDDGVRTGVSETGVRKKERREKNANEREKEKIDAKTLPTRACVVQSHSLLRAVKR